MSLIRFEEVSHTFIGPPLLDGVDFFVDPDERVCLLGRNGMGKSTMLRLIAGELEPDLGRIVRQQGLRVAYLPQEVPREMPGTIFERVSAAAKDVATHEIEAILTRMDLEPDQQAKSLSAGMKRRVLLAESLAARPDLVLLDEPTNHLDIDAICWLEDFLSRSPFSLLFVTHDRTLLQRLATRIVELDRGQLRSYQCRYDKYLERREMELEAEAKQNALFDKRLAEEEAWIRKGILARRTRNEGRVRRLVEMRNQRRERRDTPGKVKLNLQVGQQSGRKVIKAKNVTFGYGEVPIVANFSTQIMRGDRIGIIGPNGCGKTTLLRLLLGELTPGSGNVQHGTELSVSYFDQLHAQLDPERSVADNVSGGSQTVFMSDGSKKHILGYLQEFLFSPERARSPVKQLSGGERNRLLLARMFTKPSNLLVLDEPTNDLDTETLELLEEQLLEYPGTLMVVSHDRTFLNNVVTETLVFEQDAPAGQVKSYAGGYDDWQVQRAASTAEAVEKSVAKNGGIKKKKQQSDDVSPPTSSGLKRLTYSEKMELDKLPEKIESLEAEVARMHEALADPELYQRDGAEIAKVTAEAAALESELAETYERWESLEERRYVK